MNAFPATECEAHSRGHGSVSHIPHPNGSLMATTDPRLSAFFARWVLEHYGVSLTESS